MSRVLKDCSSFALPYLDDIILFSKTFENHLNHLDIVFNRLRQHTHKVKPTKCHFAQSETNYLGFVVNGQGIRPNPNKVQSIRDLPTPTSVKDGTSFHWNVFPFQKNYPNFFKNCRTFDSFNKKIRQV